MKLTHVIASVDNSFSSCNTCRGTGSQLRIIENQQKEIPCSYCKGERVENPQYYKFIPHQVEFWKKFGIKFLAIFIGESIPDDMLDYSDNIILWNKNLDIKTSFVGQHLRIFYSALLNLPEDEMVMITDIDILPMNIEYFTSGLEDFHLEDFLCYRSISMNQIFICYNAAHPKVWSEIFNIKTENDVENMIYENYIPSYNGLLNNLWYHDQALMYNKLINYPHLKVLNREPRRLEYDNIKTHFFKNDGIFYINYDDAHFHRRYDLHKFMIQDIKNQISGNIDSEIRNIIKKEFEIEDLKAIYFRENDYYTKIELKKKLTNSISELVILPKFIPSVLPNVGQDFFEQDIYWGVVSSVGYYIL